MSARAINPTVAAVKAVNTNRGMIYATTHLGHTRIVHPVITSALSLPGFPDPSAGPVRADSEGMLPGSITSISGDGSRYGIGSRAYYHINMPPSTIPYELPGTNGPNPRYGGMANPPDITDNMRALSPCSTADQGPDGTEKWGRFPEL